MAGLTQLHQLAVEAVELELVLVDVLEAEVEAPDPLLEVTLQEVVVVVVRELPRGSVVVTFLHTQSLFFNFQLLFERYINIYKQITIVHRDRGHTIINVCQKP